MEQMTEKRWHRSEVPEEFTWDLTHLFADRESWEKELLAIETDLATVTKFKGRLHTGAKVFLDCLRNYEKLLHRLSLAGTYASLRFSSDSTDPNNQGDMSRYGDIQAKVLAETAFIKSEILQLDEEQLNRYFQDEPGLEEFRLAIEDILREKNHTLSPETERVLAALDKVFDMPYTVYQHSKLSDMQFEPIRDEDGNEHPLSFALYEDKYEFHPDHELRRKAYRSFVKTLQQYKNTFAAAYAGEVNKQVTLAKLRGFSSVTDYLLFNQKVTKEMYLNQLNIIFNELAPHMRKYARLKKEVLGLDRMLFCDLKAPLDPEYDPPTTFTEATEIIKDALQILGPEYAEMLDKAFKERWIDRADNIGKSTGAFCSSPYGVHPYILMTWTDAMRSTFTLAHELGHAGHFYLAGKHQRFVNLRPSTFFIEAPSTLNELLLGKYLLKNADTVQQKRWVITQLLGTYYHNFVTHLLEGELQRRVYEWADQGKPINASVLTKFKGDILREFWGDSVEIDEGASLTWMRQPHYYMGLYPYTYSAGLTVSTAVSQLIEKEGQPAVERWLEVLKAGGTLPPLELIKKAGVDLSNPEPIKKAVAFVGSLVDELVSSYR